MRSDSFFPPADGLGEAAWQAASRPGGYAWWYVDASDGEYALSAIFFAGSVFSPTYAKRVRGGGADSGLAHPAVNLAIYKLGKPGKPGKLGKPRQIAWVMNEHPAASLCREPAGLRIGASRLSRQADGEVQIELDEQTTRFFAVPGVRVRGRMILEAGGPAEVGPIRLSREGAAEQHHWQPLSIGCRARVELTLGQVPLRFEGRAYHDGNYGTGRLESTFSRWGWAHGGAEGVEKPAVVLYRTCFSDGGGRSVALRREGGRMSLQAAEETAGGPGFTDGPGDFLWMPVPASFQAHGQTCERLPGALLDTPFYARFPVRFPDAPKKDDSFGGPSQALTGFGEYLDLRRFRSRGIQFLLRYKTRRVE